MKTYNLEYKWTVSKGRYTYGYNICSLYVDGHKRASCNGGGYDMQGTCLGNWIANRFPDRLMGLDTPMHTRNGREIQEYYGLTYHDPNFDPGKAIVGQGCTDRTLGGKAEGKTIEQAEADGESFGLERYQAFYSASSRIPTERHTVPLIDGACGISSVQRIGEAIGLEFQYIPTRSKNQTLYTVTDSKED